MTLNDQLRELLAANPEVTAAEAVKALPGANPRTVQSALSRLRVSGVGKPADPEHDALIRIVGMYSDALVTADEMFEMMKMIVSK